MFRFGSVVIGGAVGGVKDIRWIPKGSILKMEGMVSERVVVLDRGSRLASVLNVQEMLNVEYIEGVIDTEEETERMEVK